MGHFFQRCPFFMAAVDTDIDIDFADRDAALRGLSHIPGMVRDKNGMISRHVSGVYFQPIPLNPLTGLAAYDHDEAAELGYFKIDFLNNKRVYGGVRSMDHLDALLAREPEWELLDEPEIVNGSDERDGLVHINGNFGIVQAIRPRSVEDLAVVLALIRPGKRYLLGRDRAEIDADVWTPDERGYTFKKSHAIAYATSIVVQLNLIVEGVEAQLAAGAAEDEE